ncbi:MAG: T9SS type A sorting domain-containing protein, partial [Bacteroidales bacterium]|nr:T9SS type A sorting domain-containing protein [Bacteroidales bacterium]
DTEFKSGYISVTDGSVTYCESSSTNYSDDYISKVEFGNLSNTSVGSFYSDFTGLVMNAEPGLSYSLALTPWKSNKVRKESWRVWIDYNIDGDFTDSGELVFAADRKRNPVNGTVTIPSDAFGQTRMRVSMQYNVAPAGPCDVLSNGEVEDYTIDFVPPVPQPPVANFSGSPTTVVMGNSVQFNDLSSNTPTSWSWSFAGGTPLTSTDQHPSIAYNGIGTFSVSLTATNAEGSDTKTVLDYITVTDILPYCTSKSNSNALEWISQVDISTFSNSSGASLYSDFTDSVINLSPGSSNPITLTPQYVGKDQREFWRIWIDFNGDNDFGDADEEVFLANNKKGAVSGTLNILSYATGNTRMRVTMKNGSSPSACETFAGGEVEDYSVNFGEGDAINSSNLSEPLVLTIYPNPARETLNLIVNNADDEIYFRVFSMAGKFMSENQLQNQVTTLDLSGYPQGMYVIFVVDGETLIQKKFIKE